VSAIEHHHDEQPPKEPLARIAWAAEHVAAIFEGGALDPLRARATAAVAHLGVSSQQLEEILEQLPSLVAETAMAFERPVGPQFDLEKLRDDANARLVEMNQHYEELVQTLKKVLKEKSELTRRLQMANESLALLAATDALTGLPNRRAMEDALTRDLARASRDGTALSVVVVDIDHFKRFNDEHGHLAGDQTLHSVAEILKSCLREGDIAVRFGGEEFVLVLANTDEDNSFVVAERVRKTLADTKLDIAGQQLSITASFGVATTWPARQSETIAQLFERADTALYRAKEAGRNRVVIASPAAIAAQ
jgi:diguanylate cyclase (GGDEF)-like protein